MRDRGRARDRADDDEDDAEGEDLFNDDMMELVLAIEFA